MKRTIRLSAFVAVAIGLAFGSCQKEESGKTNNGTNGGGQVEMEWVDLGLPSGAQWAAFNLGASAPEESGDFYAWGETETKKAYKWSTYKYCTVDAEGNLLTLTKYNTDTKYGAVDSLVTLQPIDDAATATLGAGACIPTSDDWEELLRNTTSVYDSVNGVKGRRYTAANGNSIFIPVTGYYRDTTYVVLSSGSYWSSSLYEGNPVMPTYFQFGKSREMLLFGSARCSGTSVRAVRKE